MAMYFIVSSVAALAIFILFAKIGLKYVIAYDVYVDIAVTVLLIYMFKGTLTGMIAATFAGCIFSLLMLVSKLFVKPYKLEETDPS